MENQNPLSRRRFMIDLVCVGGVLGLSAALAIHTRDLQPPPDCLTPSVPTGCSSQIPVDTVSPAPKRAPPERDVPMSGDVAAPEPSSSPVPIRRDVPIMGEVYHAPRPTHVVGGRVRLNFPK